MRISVKVDRTKNYIKVRKDIREQVERLIVYGTNEVRNTAITGITQGKKSGSIRPDGSQASAVGEFPAADTGFLHSNIVVSLDSDRLGGSIESRADYSSALEFGTKNTGARPFMQPSLEQTRPKLRRRLKQVFK